MTFYMYVNDVNVMMGRFLFKASFHESPYLILSTRELVT